MGRKAVVGDELVRVSIGKLVHGGQGLGELPDGRKVFVWNALPGETLGVRLINQKKSYAEASAEELIVVSPERREPREANYLATSPWQMMSFAAENTYKRVIVEELFERQKLSSPPLGPTHHDALEWEYRNKMEYSFWGNDAGLHLALHGRSSHGKEAVEGCVLAMPSVDIAARAVVDELITKHLRAGDLKTLIIRSNQQGEAVAAIFTKLEVFPKLDLPSCLLGLEVYYSHPKSPVSVPTRLLYRLGQDTLEDKLLGQKLAYNATAFFQVNPPIFEQVLDTIRTSLGSSELIDMYAGVGSIGLSTRAAKVTLVEIDAANTEMARYNAKRSGLKVQVIKASVEQALEHISAKKAVIFDPPRAGLHGRVIKRLQEVKPPCIAYLSCNPATQARDLALLRAEYRIEQFEVYNFFPKTPHIETLAILRML